MKRWARQREHYRNNPKIAFGHQIYLNPEDFSPVSSSIATTGWLDLSLTEILAKVLRPGMTVVDVGANLGYYTLLCAKLVGKSGLVLAFEPEAFNLQLLSKSVNVNKLTNVKVFDQALSQTEGVVKLHLADPGAPQAHSIGRDWGRGTVDVLSTTLDLFWEKMERPRFDLVKVHVGSDDPIVLEGSKKVIHEVEPFIVTVFVPQAWKSHIELLDNLYANYEVYRIVRSPFLIRRIQMRELFHRGPTELFLAPQVKMH
jgi:FkbM family methyltransferase